MPCRPNALNNYSIKIFNSTQLKLIALAIMTVDHIGAFLFELPSIANIYEGLRLAGRVSAPLFLFCVTESVHKAGDKRKYLRRLYFSSVIVSACNLLFEELLGYARFGEILQSFAWTAFIIIMSENAASHFRARKFKSGMLILLGLLSLIIAVRAAELYINSFFPAAARIKSIFLNSVFNVDYSLYFVVCGVILYFLPKYEYKGLFMLALGLICPYIHAGWAWTDFILPNQWPIALSAPFIWMYNRKRGKDLKYFFYVYYPLHQYLLAAAAKLI